MLEFAYPALGGSSSSADFIDISSPERSELPLARRKSDTVGASGDHGSKYRVEVSARGVRTGSQNHQSCFRSAHLVLWRRSLRHHFLTCNCFLTMYRTIALLSLLACACSPGADTGKTPATAGAPAVTLAIVNARVWTGERATPWAEAIADSRRSDRGRRDQRRDPEARRGRHADRRGRAADRSGIHRLARPLPRRRLPAGVGAAARREDARRVRRSHQGVCRDGAGGHVDHRRRLGSQPLGRRTAAARVDRRR